MVKYRIQRKILYLNSLLIIIVTLISLGLAYFYFERLQEAKFDTMTTFFADSQQSNISQLLSNANNIALHVSFSPQIIETFSKPELEQNDTINYFANTVNEKKDLFNELLPFVINYKTIDRICLYNNKGDFIFSGKAVNEDLATLILTRQETNTILQAFLANDNTSLLFFHATDELSARKNDPEGYISLIRPIFDTRATAGEGIVLGICEIQIPLKNFIIEPDLLINKTYTILFKDTVIQEQGNLNTSKKYETFKRTIEQFPDFSIEIRANNIIEPTLRNSFIGIVILVTLLIGLLLFILEKIVLTRATNPLVELCNNMELYSLKESVQTVDKNELDEVGSLYNSFNNMVERLQNTVDELVAARTGQVEAQMLALQAQVNPHFIHNTLAIISSLAEEGKTDKVETITNKLSSLIRYSSDFSHKEKLLREELDYIQDYLDLLEERFEDDFHYQIRGRDSIDEREVPKFIIQPLIENALSHSLKFSDYPWNITVTAITTNDYWRITVADNGKGITDEKIQELTDRISQISQSSLKELMDSIKIGGFSLLNSMVRIYLMFPGNQYFDVKRNNEGGTTITIGAHTNGK